MTNPKRGGARSGAKPFRKPRPTSSRLVAFELISQVNRDGAFANIRLPELLAESTMEERDRALATELSYGTLRMQGRYDYAIGSKLDRPIEVVDAKIVDLLRIGCHQIFSMRVPTHAAVSETVEVARRVAGESKASYVNATLRSIAADLSLFERVEVDDSLSEIEKLSILHSHPIWIIESYFEALKDWAEVEALLRFNNLPAAPHLVAWPGKSSVAELLETGGEAIPETMYGVRSNAAPHEYLAIKEERAGVQDKGSQLVGEVYFSTRQLSEARRWLDLCAGPGGKAAWVYNALRASGSPYEFQANEPTPHRADLVARVIPRDLISRYDGRQVADFGSTYDRILIDAPCTGLGALRRRPEARWRRTQADLKGLVALQRELLAAGVAMLSDGGVLAYATCSPHIAETSRQVLETLHRFPELQVVPADQIRHLPEGSVLPNGTMQLWSHRHDSDSMFLALFQKKA